MLDQEGKHVVQDQHCSSCQMPWIDRGRVSRARDGGGAQKALEFQGFGTRFPLKERIVAQVPWEMLLTQLAKAYAKRN